MRQALITLSTTPPLHRIVRSPAKSDGPTVAACTGDGTSAWIGQNQQVTDADKNATHTQRPKCTDGVVCGSSDGFTSDSKYVCMNAFFWFELSPASLGEFAPIRLSFGKGLLAPATILSPICQDLCKARNAVVPPPGKIESSRLPDNGLGVIIAQTGV
ncbi:unnamed protein product [Protopolystoma xenopodis]|uniref:Uncharacterized protein n=1 Tax=Protopolystoma xenopodis TaxID=117903 RepID=A0A3S5BYI6_9PLAT|nr:unnamed protein product [Protopolystoma xenopodis]